MEFTSVHGATVPRIALGTWSMGGWMWGDSPDESVARATVERALELGVVFIDTAPVYGFGFSEHVVGRTLEELGARDRVVLATKCGLDWDPESPGDPWRDSSPVTIRRQLEDSLERLRTDHVDLYLVHWPDSETPMEDTAETLAELRAEGLVRAVGVCNHTLEQARIFDDILPLDAVQVPLSLLQRAEETDVLQWSRVRGVLEMAYSPLARGLLTGAMRVDEEPSDSARRRSMFHGEDFARHIRAVDRLDDYARRRWGRRVIHLALRWLLDRTERTVPLWGARRPEQLDPLPDVFGFMLTEDDYAEIDLILAEEGVSWT